MVAKEVQNVCIEKVQKVLTEEVHKVHTEDVQKVYTEGVQKVQTEEVQKAQIVIKVHTEDPIKNEHTRLACSARIACVVAGMLSDYVPT